MLIILKFSKICAGTSTDTSVTRMWLPLHSWCGIQGLPLSDPPPTFPSSITFPPCLLTPKDMRPHPQHSCTPPAVPTIAASH